MQFHKGINSKVLWLVQIPPGTVFNVIPSDLLYWSRNTFANSSHSAEYIPILQDAELETRYYDHHVFGLQSKSRLRKWSLRVCWTSGYPPKKHFKLKIRAILFVHKSPFSCPIVLQSTIHSKAMLENGVVLPIQSVKLLLLEKCGHAKQVSIPEATIVALIAQVAV